MVTDVAPDYIHYIYISELGCYVALAEEWLDKEKVEFIHRT